MDNKRVEVRGLNERLLDKLEEKQNPPDKLVHLCEAAANKNPADIPEEQLEMSIKWRETLNSCLDNEE